MLTSSKAVPLILLLILTSLTPACGGGGGGGAKGATQPGGVSTPPATAWTALPNPFASSSLNAIGFDPVTHALWLSVARVGMEVSTDGGKTWNEENRGLSVFRVNQISFNKLGDPIVVDSWNPPAGIFRFENGEWSAAGGATATYTFAKPILDQTGAVIEVTGWGADVFRSTDNGNNFYKSASTVTGGTGALWVSALGPDGSLYTGGEAPAGAYVSKDNGSTWTAIGPSNAAGYAGNIPAMVINGNGQLLVARDLHADGSGVQRYTGSGWAQSSTGLPAYAPVGNLCNGAGGALYAQVTERGAAPAATIYRSTDNGQTWSEFMNGITGSVTMITADSSGNMWAIANAKPNSGIYTINTGAH